MNKVSAKTDALRNMNQKTLEAFYKDFFTWSAGNVGQWLVAGIFEFMAGVLLCIPVQEFAGNDGMLLFLVPFWSIMGAFMYLMPYLQYSEGGKMCRIFSKLQYLPISLRDVKEYCFKKLCGFCLKTFLVFLVGQFFFSLVCNGRVDIYNLLYSVVCGLLVPLGVNSLILWCARN